MEPQGMTIKLRRVFNLFNPTYWIPWFVLLAVLLIWRGDESLVVRVSLDIIVLMIYLLSLLDFPGSFSIEKGTIQYTDRVRIPIFEHGKGRINVRVKYTVRRVRDVEFRQNFVERLFNVGHMRFRGSTSFDAKEKWEDRIPGRKKHVLYGIPHFHEFQEQIKELIKENTEIE